MTVAMGAMMGDDRSHQENLVEGDHVHDDHDDHCSASGSGERLVKFSLCHCIMCLCSGCSLVFTVLLPRP